MSTSSDHCRKVVAVGQRREQRPQIGIDLVGEPRRELRSLIGEAHVDRAAIGVPVDWFAPELNCS